MRLKPKSDRLLGLRIIPAAGLVPAWLRRVEARPVPAGRSGVPAGSLQDGHDSRAGSAADGPRDVPARVAGAPPLRHILVPWAVPGGVSLLRTERRLGAEEQAEIVIRRVAAGAICAAESARMNWVNAPGAQAGELCQESRSDVFRSASSARPADGARFARGGGSRAHDRPLAGWRATCRLARCQAFAVFARAQASS